MTEGVGGIFRLPVYKATRETSKVPGLIPQGFLSVTNVQIWLSNTLSELMMTSNISLLITGLPAIIQLMAGSLGLIGTIIRIRSATPQAKLPSSQVSDFDGSRPERERCKLP